MDFEFLWCTIIYYAFSKANITYQITFFPFLFIPDTNTKFKQIYTQHISHDVIVVILCAYLLCMY